MAHTATLGISSNYLLEVDNLFDVLTRTMIRMTQSEKILLFFFMVACRQHNGKPWKCCRELFYGWDGGEHLETFMRKSFYFSDGKTDKEDSWKKWNTNLEYSNMFYRHSLGDCGSSKLHLSVCVSVCPSLCLSVCVFVCLCQCVSNFYGLYLGNYWFDC